MLKTVVANSEIKLSFLDDFLKKREFGTEYSFFKIFIPKWRKFPKKPSIPTFLVFTRACIVWVSCDQWHQYWLSSASQGQAPLTTLLVNIWAQTLSKSHQTYLILSIEYISNQLSYTQKDVRILWVSIQLISKMQIGCLGRTSFTILPAL
jgi:hypothetical protein